MNKWQRLVLALQQESDLLGSRIEADTLRQRYEEGNGWIIEEGGEIVACSFLWKTEGTGWYEGGTAWVSLAFRKRGLGARLFEARADPYGNVGCPHTSSPIPRKASISHSAADGWRPIAIPGTPSRGMPPVAPMTGWQRSTNPPVPCRAGPECRMFCLTLPYDV